MAQFHVVVTDDRYQGQYDIERSVLQSVDAELVIHDLTSEDQAMDVLREADAVLANLFPVGAPLIACMNRCQIISRYGVGYDNVDVGAATEKGIWVANVPDYAGEDVSDHAMALLMASVRKIPYLDRGIRNGGWNWAHNQPVYRVKDRVLGLIGFGAIAKAMRRKVSGLGLSRVLGYDPYVDASTWKEHQVESVTLEELLRASDFISVHAPLTEATKNMIGAEQLEIMKNEAILINTSRGHLLDEQKVAQALSDGKIAYAGLDVFQKEPIPQDSPLRGLENVVLSDHAGWYSEEAKVELKTKTATNIANVLQGNRPSYPVNQI